MKKILFVLLTIVSGLNLIAQHSSGISASSYNCENGLMDFLKVEPSFKTERISKSKQKKGLYIEVDLKNKSKHFISETEYYYKNDALTIDTSNLGYLSKCKTFSPAKKIKIAKQKRLKAKKQAAEIHREMNQGQQIISLVNRTKKDISFPSICGAPVIVLQAKDLDQQWKTIRFIEFATCGNCYSFTGIPKKNKLDLIVALPEKGDLKTSMRFKMLYDNEFIYSNEFIYNINYCDFFEKDIVDGKCFICKATDYNTLEIIPSHWTY